ncbi:MAG: c-type cytochrome biogenesis protein CcmI [Gammaproteobacteria bacterium]|nr:c-type cytochrome biogenesis protein CcmI [Gammaproteobacteria bacterium]
MMTFWIISAIMIALAIAFIAPALLRKQQQSEGKEYRDGQNVAIAREHLHDLDEELANGTLTPALYDQSKLEIEQTLLFDLEEQGTIAQANKHSRAGKMGFIAVLIAIPLLTILLYQQIGTPQFIDASTTTMPAQHSGSPLPSLEQMVANLQRKLEQDPDNAQGWYLMGRTLMSMKKYTGAVDAYEKTNRLAANEPTVMLALADAITMAQGGDMTGRPSELVFAAIAIDPNHSTGLWMAGMIAEEQGENEKALDLWLRLRPLLSAMPEEVEALDRLIKRVAGKLNKDVSQLLTTTSANPNNTGNIGASIKLSIQIDKVLAGKVKGEETLFIYAKAMQGPRFPLAAARYQVKDLPLTITLDDSNAVMATAKLSNFKQIRVGARISYSGDAITHSGDLIGEVQDITVGQEAVTIIIDRVSP